MTEPHVFRLRLDASDIIRSYNQPWEQFAIENGAPQMPRRVLGQPIWRFMSGSTVTQVYQQLFSQVRMSGKPVTVPFRCDSPELKRYMEMTIVQENGAGLELVTSLLRTEPQTETIFLDAKASTREQTLGMCAWCKKVRLPSGEWADTEAAVRALGLLNHPEPPGFSHTMCPACLKTYLPG